MVELTGLWMALATFLGIWWGHVGVRWLEAHVANIWPSTILLTLGGIGLNVASVFAPNLTLSGVASIIGITLLWDAFEMYRQQHRVMKGHAPANPDNPRHAAYLAAGMGTTEDLLDREPTGQPVAPQAQTAPAPRPEVGVVGSPARDYSYEEVEA
jgi:hypothetical protein